MTQLVSLMYHAIYQGQEELDLIPMEERPYSVSIETFKEHLALLKSKQIPVVLNPEDTKTAGKLAVQITFDDGDAGWFKHALPALEEHGYKGVFFTTSDLIDSRDDFCDWEQIKCLADAGMSVQSHGRTHRFLSDLSESDCREEYQSSKARLEEATGVTVTDISFPGGRHNQDTVSIGRKAGYRHFYTSKVGINGNNDLNSGMVKRFEVRASTTISQFENLVTGNLLYIRKLELISGIKNLIKKLLGNGFYHQVYKLVKG
ncbi:MAG: polysaccharide deacetylase family protein [Pseudomonadales bacterium]|nr:polysaccharide deacetylase family protein [Pseudomonadales bacterium]